MSQSGLQVCFVFFLMITRTADPQAQCSRQRFSSTHSTTVLSEKATLDSSYRKLAAEEQLTAYSITLPPHASTSTQPHRHDYLLISLEAADLEAAGSYGNTYQLHMKSGEMQVMKGGWPHRISNVGDAAARLLEVDVESDIEPEHALCGLSAPACTDGRFGKTEEGTYSRGTLFETPGVRLRRIELGPGGVFEQHAHVGPEMLVALTPVHLSEIQASGEAEVDRPAGEIQAYAAGTSHRMKNIGSEPARFLEFEVK